MNDLITLKGQLVYHDPRPRPPLQKRFLIQMNATLAATSTVNTHLIHPLIHVFFSFILIEFKLIF